MLSLDEGRQGRTALLIRMQPKAFLGARRPWAWHYVGAALTQIVHMDPRRADSPMIRASNFEGCCKSTYAANAAHSAFGRAPRRTLRAFTQQDAKYRSFLQKS